MNTISSNRNRWLLLAISAFICISIHFIQYNWTLHARLNLLLQGYVFCHFEPPSELKTSPPLLPAEFVSTLVYNNGSCVGYLNPYGDFRTVSDVAHSVPQSNRFINTTIILFYAE